MHRLSLALSPAFLRRFISTCAIADMSHAHDHKLTIDPNKPRDPSNPLHGNLRAINARYQVKQEMEREYRNRNEGQRGIGRN